MFGICFKSILLRNEYLLFTPFENHQIYRNRFPSTVIGAMKMETASWKGWILETGAGKRSGCFVAFVLDVWHCTGEIGFQGWRGTLDAMDVREWARFCSKHTRMHVRKIRCIRELQESGFDVQSAVGVL